MAAQRLMLQELADAVRRLGADKEAFDTRLHQVFGLVDQRFAEAQANTVNVFNGAQTKFDTMAGTVSSIASEVMQRMDRINEQINQIRLIPPSPPASEPGVNPTQCPPPPSWVGGPTSPASGAGQIPPHTRPQPQPQPQPRTNDAPNFGGQSTSADHGVRAPQTGFQPGPHPQSQPNYQQGPHPTTQSNHGPFGSQVPHFNLGSPGSPLNGTLPQWAPGAGTENRPFDPRDWSVEGKKPIKELGIKDFRRRYGTL